MSFKITDGVKLRIINGIFFGASVKWILLLFVTMLTAASFASLNPKSVPKSYAKFPVEACEVVDNLMVCEK